MIAIPDWILDNESQYRPTEILVPVKYGIGPVWSHSDDRGGWFARIKVVVPLTEYTQDVDDEIMSCNHCHTTEDEAWACSEVLGRVLAEAVLTRG